MVEDYFVRMGPHAIGFSKRYSSSLPSYWKQISNSLEIQYVKGWITRREAMVHEPRDSQEGITYQAQGAGSGASRPSKFRQMRRWCETCCAACTSPLRAGCAPYSTVETEIHPQFPVPLTPSTFEIGLTVTFFCLSSAFEVIDSVPQKRSSSWLRDTSKR